MKNLPLPYFLILTILSFSCKAPSTEKVKDTNWSGYLGGNGTNQYSPLAQINIENVKELKVAWTYSSNDKNENNRSQIQCNPLVVDGIIYGSTPTMKFFALDAKTGEELWLFNPFEEDYKLFGMGVNRGLCMWQNGTEKKLLFTAGSFIYALDAQTGKPITTFGNNGKVDMHDGLGRDVSDLFIVSNSPGIIYDDLLIMGNRVSESIGAAPGHIRAYNVHSGKQEWIFHTIPHPDEPGNETWPKDAWKTSGGANAWSGMSLDEKRGIVFVPTGSASFDFYGGDRKGDNLYANCVLALNAKTGEKIWHYQTVHHDLWDRDLPCPPNLVQVEKEGKMVDAVAQVTKSSLIFLLDRETGKPLFPIEEKEFPASLLKGESASKTQPIPTLPKPFSRTQFLESDITNRSPEANSYVEAIWKNVLKGDYVPPSEQGAILIPGLDGGGEWGGGSFDPETQNLYINASEMPWIIQMLPYTKEKDGLLATEGMNLYKTQCQVCHGVDLKGASIHTVPSLVDVEKRLNEGEIIAIIKNGKGMMPAFANLEENKIKAIAAFLTKSKEKIQDREEEVSNKNDWPYPYVFGGYKRFTDPDGYPAITTPWGTLNAINLKTGELTWKVPLGNFDELESEVPTGRENYGGPVVTAGGLIFIGATGDEKFRVFNKFNGDLLFETDLPAGAYATPSVYAVDGKQYVVIACGGGKIGTKSGDKYVAFSL